MKPKQQESVKWSKSGGNELFVFAVVGSLSQRHWKQRPRSSPTSLYHSSLDRFVLYVCIIYCPIILQLWFPLEQELISPWFGAYLLSVITLSLDIVSDFDCSCLHELLHPVLPQKPLAPSRIPRGVRHRDSNCSWLGRSPHHDMSPKTPGRSQSPSITFSDSSLSLSQRKAKVTPLFSTFSQKQRSAWEWEELDPMRVINCLKSELLSCCYLFCCCFFLSGLGSGVHPNVWRTTNTFGASRINCGKFLISGF